MLTSSCKNISIYNSIQIYVNNEINKEVENQKLVGVMNDKTLSWVNQIDAVSLSRRITLVQLLSKCVGKQRLNQY